MPLSGISRWERVTQEIDVPGAIAFDTSATNRIIHQFQESW
jgi:hypothetical protein